MKGDERNLLSWWLFRSNWLCKRDGPLSAIIFIHRNRDNNDKCIYHGIDSGKKMSPAGVWKLSLYNQHSIMQKIHIWRYASSERITLCQTPKLDCNYRLMMWCGHYRKKKVSQYVAYRANTPTQLLPIKIENFHSLNCSCGWIWNQRINNTLP